MTAFAPADWFALLQGAGVPAPTVTDDGLLARHLDGYRFLLESWQQALRDGAAEPGAVALTALAHHVEHVRLRQLRGMCSPGPWFEALISVPLPPPDLLPAPELLPGWLGAGLGLWQALQDFQQRLDAFCEPYRGLGTRTLARLEQMLADMPQVDSVAGLYTYWLRCQDASEATIVRAEPYAGRLAQVASAAAGLRTAHRQWLEHLLGMEDGSAAQRAFSDEIAAIRRQLRELTQAPGRRT